MRDNLVEIGGYFGLEEFDGREYHGELISVNSGRNALLYIIKAKDVKKLYIPSFLCDTVYKLCQRENIDYDFYHIGGDFRPLFCGDLKEGEWLYVVNYYGQLTDGEILDLKKQYANIILDNVQDFFRKPIESVDTLYSCRKFFGVPDGGYVSTDRTLSEKLVPDCVLDRMEHILGRFQESASEFYPAFQKNDELFYKLELGDMSRITKNILKAVDYEAVKRKRNENYAYLQDRLGSRNKLNLTTPDGALCYPFYCENGAEIRKELAKNKIYIPTLWPNVLEEGNDLEKDYAQNILPLPCDQRYVKENMEHMLSKIISLM